MIYINNKPILTTIPDIIYKFRKQYGNFEKIRNLNRDYIMVSCPYHNNKREPDMGILKHDIIKNNRTIKAGIAHCFGCGKVISLQNMLSDLSGNNQWIEKNFSVCEIENRKNMIKPILKQISKPHKYVSEEVLKKFHHYHPYMSQRYLTKELISWYNIGYNKVTNSITFPVKDSDGNCLFIAQRRVDSKFYSYPKNIKKPLYGEYEAKRLFPDCKSMYICESFLDALMFIKWGKPALALMGTGTKEQIKRLDILPYRVYIIATDNDEAGEKAYKKLKQNLVNKFVKRFKFKGKDINENGYKTWGEMIK